ncbi:MAG: hypothetical protein K5885_10345, partial [Bacteroidales bacterium]|nr:hypothetical protein [Bacteroidales bacterium]
AVYCWLGLGEMQMTKTPVIILPDWKVVIASLVLAVAGVCLLKKKFIGDNGQIRGSVKQQICH